MPGPLRLYHLLRPHLDSLFSLQFPPSPKSNVIQSEVGNPLLPFSPIRNARIRME